MHLILKNALFLKLPVFSIFNLEGQMTLTEKKVEECLDRWLQFAQELFCHQDWDEYVRCLKLQIDVFFERYASHLNLEEQMKLYRQIEELLFNPDLLYKKMQDANILQKSSPPGL